MTGDVGGATVFLGDLGHSRTAVVLDPHVEVLLYVREGDYVVGSAMGVDDGYGAYAGLGRDAAHGIAADGGEGCDTIGYLVHGVIGKHATHGEA